MVNDNLMKLIEKPIPGEQVNTFRYNLIKLIEKVIPSDLVETTAKTKVIYKSTAKKTDTLIMTDQFRDERDVYVCIQVLNNTYL